MIVCCIRGFRSDRGRKEINEWYKQQDFAVKAKFDVRVKYLSQRKQSEWEMPYFRILHGACKDLGEIRFFCNKVQHRAIGFFSASAEFIILLFAVEKGGKLEPRSCCDTAQERKQQVLRHRERYSHEWEIDT